MSELEEMPVALSSLQPCFEGIVPADLATASASGIPNVTYLSRVRYVDEDHIALSNQFLSKTTRNLAENPRASLLLIDPTTWDQFRLTIVFERTIRKGPVFDKLREDVDEAATFHGMEGVFKLRAADVFRVVDIERLASATGLPAVMGAGRLALDSPVALSELVARLSRCPDLDSLVGATVAGLDELLGYPHSSLLLLDEAATRLFTIASHGYDAQGVGSEVPVGEGTIGMAAARAAPMRIGNLRQMHKYSNAVRRAFEEEGSVGPGRDVPLPGLADAESRLAVPAIALGQLVGVLAVESARRAAFDDNDEAVLRVVASLVASAIEIDRSREQDEPASPEPMFAAPTPPRGATHVKYFPVDGSVFLDGEYLIRGVAGRVLWSLLEQHDASGRVDFTQKEIRLDPRLELPGFRDNLDARLILLKRRLHEREAPMQLEKTGRGRFRLEVDGLVRLESVET